MIIRKSFLLANTILINTAIYADVAPAQNFSSLQLPAGSGYFWCNVTPMPKKDPKATAMIAINEKNLKDSAAYIATNCVDVSGMVCGGWSSAASGTLQTDMWWLKNHYFKYSKAGMQFNEDDPTCQTAFGVVQLRVSYDYTIQCQAAQNPPTDRELVDKPAC